MPGVHLNLSKSGVSTSIGGPGATINLGSKGARATLGIPGTGVYYSTKLGGGGTPAPTITRDWGACGHHVGKIIVVMACGGMLSGLMGLHVWIFVAGSLWGGYHAYQALMAAITPIEIIREEISPVAGSDIPASIDGLSPVQFEAAVGGLLEKMGYTVTSTPRSGDGGVDLVATDPTPITGGKLVVQCKHTNVVGSPVVRDLYGAMQHHGATKGILVTSGRITADAREWAQGKPLDLVDGDALVQLIERYR